MLAHYSFAILQLIELFHHYHRSMTQGGLFGQPDRMVMVHLLVLIVAVLALLMVVRVLVRDSCCRPLARGYWWAMR